MSNADRGRTSGRHGVYGPQQLPEFPALVSLGRSRSGRALRIQRACRRGRRRLSWNGDPRLVGSGWQEIIESKPYRRMRMHLDFDQQGASRFVLQIDGRSACPASPGGSIPICSRDKACSGDCWPVISGCFSTGGSARTTKPDSRVSRSWSNRCRPRTSRTSKWKSFRCESADILYVRNTADGHFGNLGSSLAAAYREIATFMAGNEIERAGQPMTITRRRAGQGYEVDAAIPVFPEAVEPGARVLFGKIARRTGFAGHPPRSVRPGWRSYEKVAAWMAAHGLAEGPVSWEQYISDPGADPAGGIDHPHLRSARR